MEKGIKSDDGGVLGDDKILIFKAMPNSKKISIKKVLEKSKTNKKHTTIKIDKQKKLVIKTAKQKAKTLKIENATVNNIKSIIGVGESFGIGNFVFFCLKFV